MVSRLKDNISLTLVEVLIAMLILSTSAAGVLGSFSYAFKFILRAGAKIEAMNYGRKAMEAYRALTLVSASDPRLSDTPAVGEDVKGSASPNSIDTGDTWFSPDYGSDVKVIIADWANNGATGKQISVKVDWNAP
ncbi:MAG: hypothetical protein COW11_04695 [Candidatus Omnitrophica bacterium CG12_big_fil_rev_8_21_14_0_65_43_15]|uniref:Uncharacterized protein n=1 Tax=Candidatus Taenaricola geysiri TaxID=1974752 RepID=A0A2J0LQQ5_9BACT|nr:MAG: hypothetical protein AUJ89_04640 [Candidatus Omnitrophica bacterium CG1_02_43_210]PIV12508.1 MAG: hypothetical protein COS48_00275 [Candidatus Omnitrophica bacterium CG03_land_8_20_14_0_80_43_22]PIW66167.1 MAG: hypothetical protein COW11_04695 [Candidatus Omnitrophica bacterium CG12_big_fil_rev_8_21_14_0_65_43_15]PIW80226.1 MAG: hypothetical protein COZ98_03190 [Candidatus Omnitrophica bacterium CG_4_8_14_3_um_filter_43_15]PIY84283.1 MAG: hypothetical protein COY77_03355 [Candidatus Omn